MSRVPVTLGYDMPPLALDAGVRAVRAVQEFQRAEIECARYVPNTLVMDNAVDVYDAALTAMGCDTSDLLRTGNAAAMRAAFLQLQRSSTRPRVAMDSKVVAGRAAMFPNANRLK